MLSDIEIAQNAKIKPITEIAEQAGIDPDRIILEDRSYSTLQNLQNSRMLIEGRGDDPETAAAVVQEASETGGALMLLLMIRRGGDVLAGGS